MNINISINTNICIIMIDRSKHKCSSNNKKHAKTIKKLDPVGSIVCYEMMIDEAVYWVSIGHCEAVAVAN